MFQTIALHKIAKSTLLPGIVALAMCLTSFVIGIAKSGTVSLLIDARIQGSGIFEVYVNEEYTLPRRFTVEPGVRKIYRLENLPAAIKQLRLDPVNTANTEVEIYTLSFLHAGSKVGEIGARDLKSWPSVGFERSLEDAVVLKLRSTSSDPILYGSPNLVLTDDTPISSLYRDLVAAPGPVLLIWLLFWFIVLYAALNFDNLSYFLFALYYATVLCISYLVIQYALIWWPPAGAPPSASQAAGMALMFGVSYAAELKTFFLAAAIALIMPALLALPLRKLIVARRTANPLPGKPPATPAHASLLCLLALVAIAIFPPAADLARLLNPAIHFADFDSQNLTTWKYMVHHGWLPYRDFWYPYTGQYLFILPWPPACILNWLHVVALFSVVSFCLLKFFDNRFSWVLLPALIFIIAAENQALHVVPFKRYGLNLAILLLVWLNCEQPKRFFCGLLGITTGYTIFFEPAQLIYATPGAVFLLASFAWLNRAKPAALKSALRSFSLAALVGGLMTALVFYVLWQQDQLPGFLRLYKSLNVMTAYALMPVDFQQWLRFSKDLNSLVFFYTLLALATSVLHLATRPMMAIDLKAFLPLALSLNTLMVFQKHLVRPMETAFIFMPLLVILMLAFLSARRPLPAMLKMSLAVVLGLTLQVFAIETGILRNLISATANSLLSFHTHLKATIHPAVPWTTVAKTYFSEQRLVFGDTPGPQLKRKLLETTGLPKLESLYVLGDDSYLYMLFNLKPPPHINFYNTSPLASQKEQLDWLVNSKPQWVIWNENIKDFDLTPHILRVPLLFKYIMAHYVPAARVEQYAILKRGTPTLESWHYWNQALGTRLNMAFIPALSGVPQSSDRRNRHRPLRSAPFVTISYAVPPRAPGSHTIRFQAGNEIFEVSYNLQPGTSNYHIRIDRLWFYNLARILQMPFSILPDPSPERKISMSRLALKRDILY